MKIYDLMERKSKNITRVYHVTPRTNLQNIKKYGLVPQLGANSQKVGETDKAIHVFLDQNTLTDAMMNWETMNWNDEDEPELSLLALDVPASMLSSKHGVAEIYQRIPPSMIVNITEIY